MNKLSKLLLVVTVSFSGLGQANNEVGFSKVVSVGGNGVTIRDTDSGWFVGGFLSLEENERSNDTESTQYISAVGGLRNYLDNGIADLKTFYEGSVRVSHHFSDNDYTSYRAKAVYGVEKFLSTEVSIEAAVGVALDYFDANEYNSTDISTPVGSLSINYYFD